MSGMLNIYEYLLSLWVKIEVEGEIEMFIYMSIKMFFSWYLYTAAELDKMQRP